MGRWFAGKALLGWGVGVPLILLHQQLTELIGGFGLAGRIEIFAALDGAGEVVYEGEAGWTAQQMLLYALALEVVDAPIDELGEPGKHLAAADGLTGFSAPPTPRPGICDG